jgi:arginase
LSSSRDATSPWYGPEVLRAGPMIDLTGAWIAEHGAKEGARAALVHMQAAGVDGFWIHVDADVLDPTVIPAVDSPEPGGLGLDELADLLTPLVRQPGAIGLELTIYDPTLDPERTSVDRLVALLERVLAPDGGKIS